ncbi:hypothetical protein B7486_65650, partial [cyanobacterium TDX16]
EKHLEERRDQLHVMLRDLLQEDSLELLTPTGREGINVRLRSSAVPLESMGSGIEEVILIALARLQHPESLLLLEEPDVHLHPLLQRRLALALRDHKPGASLVATHSPHIIDVAKDVVLAVSIEDGLTRVRKVADPHLFEQLALLGYRASDLLQTNCLIWVEGPSDRVYIKFWLSRVAPELREGI